MGMSGTDVAKKVKISNKIQAQVDQMSPRLRKLFYETLENLTINSISKACEVTGANYQSIKNAINSAKKKGINYNELLREAVDERNNNLLPYIDNKLAEEALVDGVPAKKLFYQRTKAIDNAPKININNTIQTMFAVPSANAKPVDLRGTVEDDSGKKF